MCNNHNNKNQILNKNKVIRDNAMLKVRPDFWDEWHFEKNEGINIYSVTKGMKNKVWWICSKCKSYYDMTVLNKVNGQNCPYCSGRRANETNSLASLRPEIAKYWHPTLNGDLTPHDVTQGSAKKVWWICSDCESSYDMTIKNKTLNNYDCPYCSCNRVNANNCLVSTHPDLASQWHPTKNGDLSPFDMTYGSSRLKVWWLGECGHEWEATVNSRTNSDCSCPYCAGLKVWVSENDMWTTNPELASLLDNHEDGYEYKEYSNKKLDWRCPICEEVVKNKRIADVNLNGVRCPNCSSGKSFPERFMYNLLKELGLTIHTEKTFDWSQRKRYDFYIPSLNMIVETHGEQHYKQGFQKESRKTLESEQKNDRLKEELALQNGIAHYIVINCSRSNIEYILNSVKNTELANFINLEKIDIKSIEKSSITSTQILVKEFWEQGMSATEIQNETSLHRETILNTLRKFTKLGLISYDKNINKNRELFYIKLGLK